MREQRDTLAAQRLPQRSRSEQAIQTELHRALPSSADSETGGVVEIGLVAADAAARNSCAARAILDDGASDRRATAMVRRRARQIHAAVTRELVGCPERR